MAAESPCPVLKKPGSAIANGPGPSSGVVTTKPGRFFSRHCGRFDTKGLAFEGITGTSAGAVNAVVLADGLAAGGRQAAREALRVYWRKVSMLSSRSLMP